MTGDVISMGHWMLGISYLLGAFTLTLLWRIARAPNLPATFRRTLWAATVLFVLSVAVSAIGVVGERLSLGR